MLTGTGSVTGLPTDQQDGDKHTLHTLFTLKSTFFMTSSKDFCKYL